AEMVTELGGRGIAVRVDHTVEAEVSALFERIDRESGRLDILVNDIWGGDASTEWGKSFWELDCDQGFRLLERAIHTHVLTSRHGAPLMLRENRGLIVEVTDGDEAFNRMYRGNVFYDMVKTTIIRLAFAMSEELRDTGVTALALTPGFLRSEAVLEHFGVSESNWRDAIDRDPYFADSETPDYIGRAVAALAADACVKDKAGRTHSTASLAREYGFRDSDGRQPDIAAVFDRVIEERWRLILDGLVQRLHARGQDPDRVLSGDRSTLELRGALPGGRLHRWRVQVMELFTDEPGEVAARFDESYRRAAETSVGEEPRSGR
ncbi:MAG: SDR family oxidoreductase, partial [Planctomycetes bacterium]|nr:SDR family oxidoreductase [Planctomycetota bacterium]